MKRLPRSAPGFRQRGAGLLAVLGLAFLLFFGALTVIKIYPPLYEYFNVRSSMAGLVREAGAAEMSEGALRRGLSKRFRVNEVRSVDRRDVSVEQTADGRRITVEYEVRRHWFWNVDLVFQFQHTVEATR